MIEDGCTAGPLSDFLNSLIYACCVSHDQALGYSYDLSSFLSGNWDFFLCSLSQAPLVALPVFLAVASPFGWLYYQFSEKRKDKKE